MDRLEQQMNFILEVDKLKKIGRQTYLSDGSRKENDAEHSWHLALMAILLGEHANEKVDVLKVVSLVLIHDIIEIDAGDTYAYDDEGNKTKREREEKAADRIFNLLPKDQAVYMRELWEEFEAGDRAVLNIEPGLAFGTGTHETTRLCLETLEKYIKKGTTVLDIGCGSGILSIASLLLGAEKAVGVDIDALAVKTAKENGEVNGFKEPEYTILQGNLTDKVSGKFDVVVANIVADVIIMFCKDVASFMKDGGVFITSGIIDTREQDVIDAFNKYGFKIEARHTDGGWVCFECKK